ncbi:MAG: hypothetical protein HC822_25760 [Oscillochloris sp.]|nr:hypothetical protein [Oscillochloris sp.]
MMIGSSPDSTTTSEITVDRLVCRLNLPDSLAHPLAVRDQLERIARREVARACAAASAPLAAEDAEAVYRIRHLHLDLWVDTQAMSDAEIAERWGRLLARAIMQAIRQGGTQHVMRFASPRHFVAAFLRDLLAGRAWSRWYYDEFLPLRRLAAEAIALQMCIARPEWIAPLLRDLGDPLIERWGAAEIARIWAALDLPAQAGGHLSTTTLRSLQALQPTNSGFTVDARARDKLRLWLALAADQPQAAHDPQIVAGIHALIDLAALLRAEPEVQPLLAMHSPLYPALIRRIAAGPLADLLPWLAVVAPAITAQIAARPPTTGPLISSAGGVFLLLPALVELGIWEHWRAEVDAAVARNWLFAVALKVFGHERAPLLLGDPVLAAFAGMDAPPPADARLPQEADRPTGPWMQALPQIAARWYAPQDRDLVAAVAHDLAILRDAGADHWLAVGQWMEHGPVRAPTLDEQAALEAEVAYFRLGSRLGYSWLTPALDAALSAVAILALRRTAARLPGFSRSSPIYTARRFVANPATFDPAGLSVRLQGGPLAVVLRMAGMPWTIDAPWLAQPLTLALDQG